MRLEAFDQARGYIADESLSMLWGNLDESMPQSWRALCVWCAIDPHHPVHSTAPNQANPTPPHASPHPFPTQASPAFEAAFARVFQAQLQHAPLGELEGQLRQAAAAEGIAAVRRSGGAAGARPAAAAMLGHA